MELSYYTNMAGQRFGLPDRPLEPQDCWGAEPSEPNEEDYNEEEDLWQ